MPVKPVAPGVTYRLLWLVLGLPVLMWTLLQAWRARSATLLRQRLGWYGDLPRHGLWIHAASVGEVNAAALLVQALRDERPDLIITLSTLTPSGAQQAKRLLPEVTHFYLPWDTHGACERLLQRLQPRLCVFVETEIWPQLYSRLARAQVTTILVNGRLSARTLSRPAWVRRYLARALQNIDHVYARNEQDQQGFLRLGMTPERVTVQGNIKFAIAITTAGPITPPSPAQEYILAASTRDAEEQIIIDAWRHSHWRGYPLVIVPRHPQRLNDILGQVKPLKLPFGVRSHGDDPGQCLIYIADTFGELRAFMQEAELVIIGGSFVAKGGQNPLEAAAAQRAMIFGPYMANFAEEADALVQAQAALQAAHPQQLLELLNTLYRQPSVRQSLGQNARAYLAKHTNLAKDYAQKVLRHWRDY